MRAKTKLPKYFVPLSLVPLILSIGIIPSLAFGYFPGSPYHQQVQGIAIEKITCRDDRVLMISPVGKPGCAFKDHVDDLEEYGWAIIQKEFSDTESTRMTLSAEEAESIAEDAYIYGFPLVMMKLTEYKMANVAEASPQTAPVNQFAHLPQFPTPDFKDVVRPNADTLYSISWLDLSDEPTVLHVPDTDDRFYLMQMLDAYTNVFASPGKRTTGTDANDFAITGPFWEGTLPNGVTEIKSPTNMVWIIGRTQTNGVADFDAVNAIQKQYTLTPLSSFGESYQPPQNLPVDSSIDMITPPVEKIVEADLDTFFNIMAKLMKDNPPAPEDAEMISKFSKIGLIPGEKFDSSNFDSQIISAIESSAKSARQKIVENVQNMGVIENGWQRTSDVGDYGTDYLFRASIALFGLGANLDADALYPATFVDGNGDVLNGANNYVIHFPNGQTPPVNAFWSITMYEGDFFTENPIDRYAIGDRDELEFNGDGSLDIYIQHEALEGKESNWLPAPEGDFNLAMRMYWPQEEAFDGTWEIPPVQKSS